MGGMSGQRRVDQVCGGEDRRANGGFIQEGDAREVGVEAAGWGWWGGENLIQDRLPGGAATIQPERRWKKKMSKTKAERK